MSCSCVIMPSPFPRNSRDYLRAVEILQTYRRKLHEKQMSDDVPFPLRSLLDRTPDARGTYKKVYFEEADNSVLFLEIGSLDFLKTRRDRMKALSAFSADDNLLLPVEQQVYTMKTRDGLVCFVVSSTNRCSVDLFLSLTGAQALEADFVLQGLVSLAKTLSRLNESGIFFTDVKLENIVVCGTGENRRLSFIDLDSVILEKEVRNKQSGTVSMPVAKYFVPLREVFLRDGAYAEGSSTPSDDLVRFYEFYSLFAFSHMVFETYFLFFRTNQIFSTNPSFFLPASEEAMQTELEQTFKIFLRQKREKKKLILMSYRVLQFVLRSSDFAETIVDTWYDTLESKAEKKERKAERRREALNPNTKKKASSAKLLL